MRVGVYRHCADVAMWMEQILLMNATPELVMCDEGVKQQDRLLWI